MLTRHHSLRPTHGVEDGKSHVWPAELRQDAGVAGLDHGVHDTLRVHDDLDVVVVDAKQVVRLNHLQAFIHQRGAIDGDLLAHAPVRVLERVTHARGGERGHAPVSEGAAARCQDDATQAAGGQALDALEQRRVLAVRGQDLHSFLVREREHDGAASDQRLFVR